jgi:hypothetical protein
MQRWGRRRRKKKITTTVRAEKKKRWSVPSAVKAAGDRKTRGKTVEPQKKKGGSLSVVIRQH